MNPVCAHARDCPGCPAIHLSYAQQLEAKTDRIRSAVARHGETVAGVEAIRGADETLRYRSRAKLVVGAEGQLGLYGEGHSVVDVPECVIVRPSLRRVAAEIRRLLAENPGILRAVDLREAIGPGGDERVLVTFVVSRTEYERGAIRPTVAEMAHTLEGRDPKIAGVAVNLHDGNSPQVLGPETHLVSGQKTVPDGPSGSVHFATFGSFVQAHREQARHLRASIREFFGLPGKKRILDLYGGSGAIGLELAAFGAQVTLLESFAPAARLAQEAADAQRLPLTALAGRSEDRVTKAFADSFDGLVVNPPRRGLHPVVREAIGHSRVARVAYLSCDPETLARDLAHLAQLGCAPERVLPFDMMPQTLEVETLALLVRRERPALRVLCEADNWRVVVAAPHTRFDPAKEAFRFPRGTTGIRILRAKNGAGPAPSVVFGWLLAVRGRPRRARLERLGFTVDELVPLGHHSLLRVRSALSDPLSTLRRIRHPVLGDPKGDAATNRYFFERNTLDRPFAHLESAWVNNDLFTSEMPGDLATVIGRASRREISDEEM